MKQGWRIVKFGDVVRQCKETVDRENNPFERYVEGGHMNSEDIHIRQWGVFGDDYVGPAFHRIFRKGQVLYGSRRTYLKKVAIADFDGITANTTFVCETKDPNVFLQELLPFLMLTDRFTENSIRESKGSTNPYINWPDIAKFEFPLPPLEEQKRIAEILWAADEAVDSYSRPMKDLESLRNALMDELTSTGYPTKALGETLVYASDGPFGSKLKTEHYSESGALVVRLQNIQPLRYDTTDKAFISLDYFQELGRYSLQERDILVAALGDG